MESKEHLSAIALTMLRPQLTPLQLMEIYREAGSATAIVEARHHLKDAFPAISARVIDVMKDLDNAIIRAQAEVEYAERHNIKILTPDDIAYPQRLKDCPDAPLVLYYYGNGELNAQRVVNIIGTRKCTTYGKDLIRHFVSDMSKMCPDTLIVSGLAYGVDINAHRESLANGLPTVGVVAHGLDTIYPAVHRETAKEMISRGGLLTEYPHGTRPDKRNFVQRNRIVAGMSDACILVESAKKGGGLITVEISNSYNRDVFAFPGSIGSPYSEGCNKAIREHQAQLITSAEDFVQFMGWENAAILQDARRQGIERTLFPQLTDEEKAIVNALQEHGDMQTNHLAVHTNLPISTITATMFSLEMNGIVIPLAGGKYHLLD